VFQGVGLNKSCFPCFSQLLTLLQRGNRTMSIHFAIYTQLVTVGEDKGYICKIAKTPSEAVTLIEDGFEEHTSFDNGNVKLFRKRKT